MDRQRKEQGAAPPWPLQVPTEGLRPHAQGSGMEGLSEG